MSGFWFYLRLFFRQIIPTKLPHTPGLVTCNIALRLARDPNISRHCLSNTNALKDDVIVSYTGACTLY